MSWEECGYRPGAIHGPAKCPKGACSDCDGEHHFYADCVDPDDIDELDDISREAVAAGHTQFFVCKHCGAWAELADDAEFSEDAS